MKKILKEFYEVLGLGQNPEWMSEVFRDTPYVSVELIIDNKGFKVRIQNNRMINTTRYDLDDDTKSLDINNFINENLKEFEKITVFIYDWNDWTKGKNNEDIC